MYFLQIFSSIIMQLTQKSATIFENSQLRRRKYDKTFIFCLTYGDAFDILYLAMEEGLFFMP